METTVKKMIIISDCMECPNVVNKCKAWTKLTAK